MGSSYSSVLRELNGDAYETDDPVLTGCLAILAQDRCWLPRVFKILPAGQLTIQELCSEPDRSSLFLAMRYSFLVECSGASAEDVFINGRSIRGVRIVAGDHSLFRQFLYSGAASLNPGLVALPAWQSFTAPEV